MDRKFMVAIEQVPLLEFVVEAETLDEAIKRAKAKWAERGFPWVQDAFELDDRGYRKD